MKEKLLVCVVLFVCVVMVGLMLANAYEGLELMKRAKSYGLFITVVACFQTGVSVILCRLFCRGIFYCAKRIKF